MDWGKIYTGIAGVGGAAASYFLGGWSGLIQVLVGFGFRPNKRAHSAMEMAREYIKEGYRWVVDMDLEKFFDKVNHDILMSRVARRIQDKRVLLLIRRYLQAGVMVNGCCIASEEGTPQ